MCNFIARLTIALLLAAIIIGAPRRGEVNVDYRRQPSESEVRISVVNRQVVALSPTHSAHSIELTPGEYVRSILSAGKVGGVVTTHRLLAISADTFQWNVESLAIDESSAQASVSDQLVLFVTQKRSLVYDSLLNRLIIFALPLGEYVVARRTEQDIAVIATLKQAVGYALGRGAFAEIRFVAGEVLHDLKAVQGLISVRTSRRVLVFQVGGSGWGVLPRALGGAP